jgi:hypothetical protein
MLRFVMQFKSFPLAYMQRQFGGRRWKRGDLAASGEYDITGAVGAALATFAFGWLAMTLKDFAKGRTPKQLWDKDGVKKETVFAALMQSGGAGILGDFFFNKADRFGNSFAGTLAGPLLGETGHLVNAASLALRGEVRDSAEELAKFGMNTLPFVNLWYTREAVNWLAFYHVREWISPGTLRRAERNLKKDFGQAMIISPAQHFAKGGGFR